MNELINSSSLPCKAGTGGEMTARGHIAKKGQGGKGRPASKLPVAPWGEQNVHVDL